MFQNSQELQNALDENDEGERGVQSLARMARALGYKDEQYFGQFDQECSYGDFLEFLEDNPGCVEAVKNWVSQQVRAYRELLDGEPCGPDKSN